MTENNCEFNGKKIEIDADTDVESDDHSISEIETFKRKISNSNIQDENEIHNDTHEVIRQLIETIEEKNSENRIKCNINTRSRRTHYKKSCETVEKITDKELKNGNSIKCKTSLKRKIPVDKTKSEAIHSNKIRVKQKPQSRNQIINDNDINVISKVINEIINKISIGNGETVCEINKNEIEINDNENDDEIIKINSYKKKLRKKIQKKKVRRLVYKRKTPQTNLKVGFQKSYKLQKKVKPVCKINESNNDKKEMINYTQTLIKKIKKRRTIFNKYRKKRKPKRNDIKSRIEHEIVSHNENGTIHPVDNSEAHMEKTKYKPRKFMLNDILDRNYKPQQPWLTRSRKNMKKSFLNNTRKVLDLLSGGDTVAMIADVLNKKEKCAIAKKYVDALKEFAEVSNNAKQKERFEYIKPLKKANLSIREVKKLGFKISSHLWSNCLDERVVINWGGRSSIAGFKEDVEKHMESLSSIASNRFLKKLNTNAFIRQVTLTEAYESYPNKHKVSYNKFVEFANEKFKKPHRMTDLCDYCEHGKELSKDIISKANSYGYEIKSNDNNFDLDKLREYFENLPRSSRGSINYVLDLTIQKIDDLKEIRYHKVVATKQREIYNQMRQDKELLKNSLIIEMDFKQKITLGKGPREVNSDFYNQEFRSFLGFGIYFTNENDEIDCLNMDIVFPNSNQDCFAVINAIKFIRKQKIFQDIDKKYYIFWTDCGMHFRSSEFIDFLFNDLAKENIQVNWNMFCEKHGKNARDQHFSVVSNYLNSESNTRKVATTTDIVNTIRARQQLSNDRRIKSGLKPILHWIDEISDIKESKQKKVKYKKIGFLKCLYNLRNDDDFVLKTSIFSYGEKLLNMDSLSNKFFVVPRAENYVKNTEKNCENGEEKIKQKPIVKVDYLRKKRLFIENELLNVNNSIKKTCNNEIENNNVVNVMQYNQTILNSCNNQEISVKCCNDSIGITDNIQLLFDTRVNFLGESLEETSILSFGQSVLDNNINNGNNKNFINKDNSGLFFVKNQKPNYCTNVCEKCSTPCEYKVENLDTLPQTQVNEELKRHGHPSSRRIKGKSRNTVQGRTELIEHYKYCHK